MCEEGMTRRGFGTAVLALGAPMLGAPAVRAQNAAPAAIRIGYAVSKTGPNAGGTAVTITPNYQLWVQTVNAAGGLRLGGRQVPVEVVEYDDRSSSEDAVRAIERLVNQDRVDFILPPWGTALNLAVGPVLNRAGYPHLAVNAVTDRAPELARRWPNSFWFLGTSAQYAAGLVEMLSRQREAGQIGSTVAMVSVADGFGIDLVNAARPALQRAGFRAAYDRTYPVGTQDMAPLLGEAARASPDAFIAFSYPPDTLAITEQARVSGFNPKVFYTGVGTSFPLFRDRFGANAEGIMGIGGWPAESPQVQDYMRRHRELVGREPDRWASPVVYSSLQVLQQAIERVGRVDRAAIIREIQTGTFDTILGPLKLEGNVRREQWVVGQWQGGEFYGIAPGSMAGARQPILPKPAWRTS